jgi:broad specificity polyphosphatase/5'/3'-nucleotidase SurE
MNSEKPQILLTNDVGIQFRGYGRQPEALAYLGYVTVVAPREQHSGMGRSLPEQQMGLSALKRDCSRQRVDRFMQWAVRRRRLFYMVCLKSCRLTRIW